MWFARDVLQPENGPAPVSTVPMPVQAPRGAPLNQTAAMAAVRTAMRLRGVVVYHVGLRGGQVEVSFLTPELGRRLEAELRVLSDRIGWPVAVSDHIERAQVTGQVRQIIGRGKIGVEISGGVDSGAGDR